MRRLALALTALLLPALMLLAGGSASQAEEEGTISGTVVNKTEGGGSTAGLPVTLAVFGLGEPTTQETVTDEAGGFTFEQVPVSPDAAYHLTAVYADVEYVSPIVSVDSPGDLAGQEIAVYETTSDPAAIRASLMHLVMMPDEETGSLVVSELIVIENSGDRTYVGAAADDPQEERQTLSFFVPVDALEVTIIDGLLVDNLVGTDFGFVDSAPWEPGTREVVFSYSLPYQGSDYVFRTELDFPADTVSILLAKSAGGLESGAPFVEDETVIQGQTYLRASADNLEAGAPIQVNLTDLPDVGGGNRDQAIFAALVVAVLGVAVVAGFTLYRRSRLAAVFAEDPVEREKANLLLSIAELDRQHEAGEIQDAEYHRRRTQAKERLETIW